MVSLQLEIVNGLEYTYTYRFSTEECQDVTERGRQVFKSMFINKHAYIKLDKSLDNDSKVGDVCFEMKGDVSLQELLDEEGIKIYPEVDFIGVLDHYFRNLYRIIKFVDGQDEKLLNKKDKYNYIANSVRSNLSEYELIMVFYNCLTIAGYDKFKPLIEQYTLFKNIRDNYFTENDESNDESNITKIFPKNRYEQYLEIDDLKIPEKYNYEKELDKNNLKWKLQAFYKEDEVLNKREYYQTKRSEQLERDKKLTTDIE